jgi:hypothetical protein
MTWNAARVGSVVSSVLLLAACGGEASSGDRTGEMDVVVNEGSCALDNLTATCTCPDQAGIPGRQTCLSGAWTACECDAVSGSAGVGSAGSGVAQGDGGMIEPPATTLPNDPPGNQSANRFEWKQTAFELGSCKAGHYIGMFEGDYRSPAAWTFPVSVSGEAGADGAPGLEFWLEKTPGSGEIFSVNGGKMRGTANGQFPFTADLTGTLDCATKKYVGRIENGQYMVFGVTYLFEGDVTADYDKVQNKFIAGKWLLVEPANAFAGGELDWEATWSMN